MRGRMLVESRGRLRMFNCAVATAVPLPDDFLTTVVSHSSRRSRTASPAGGYVNST